MLEISTKHPRVQNIGHLCRLVRNINRSEVTQAAGHAVRGVNFDLPYLDEFLVEEGECHEVIAMNLS